MEVSSTLAPTVLGFLGGGETETDGYLVVVDNVGGGGWWWLIMWRWDP